MANHVGPNNSHRQGYKMTLAMAADLSENLQLFQRNYKLLVKENVFLDLFVMVFEEHNLK